jgi:hypothetical protein
MQALATVAENAEDPAWVGACLSSTLTHGAKHPDDTPVIVPELLQGLVEANMPRLRAYAEEMLPQLIALAFRSDLAKELSAKSHLAKGVSSLGGGLKGAQALQHGVKSMGGGPLAVLGQIAEAAPALKELAGFLQEMRSTGSGGVAPSSPQGRLPPGGSPI